MTATECGTTEFVVECTNVLLGWFCDVLPEVCSNSEAERDGSGHAPGSRTALRVVLSDGLRSGAVWFTILSALGFIGSSTPKSADAASYRVRTYSLGRATQTFRSDRTAAPRRTFTQGLDLRAYDLLGDRTGRLNAALGARYTTDFAIPSGRRDDPLHAHRWNDFALRLAYLDWRATQGVELRLGRQWSRGSLGIRDFDGLRLELTPRLDPATHGLLVLYGGRDVQLGTASYNTDSYDVQGLPSSNSDDVAPIAPDPSSRAWIAGGRVGLGWEERRGSVEFSYRKRWRTAPDSAETRTGSERFGLAASATPRRRLTVSTAAAYHTLLGTVDEASLDVAWNAPGPFGTVSTGVEHRHPWFDASSIFNLFGTRPHQGGHATYQQGVPELRTEFEARTWGRIYRGDPQSTGFRRTSRKTTRVGGALAHQSELYPWGHFVDWSSQFSLEADTAGEESSHVLADTRARTPVAFDDLFLHGRVLLLATTAQNVFARSGAAATYVLGVDIPVPELGTFSLMAERTVGTYHRPTMNIFGTLKLEFWR